MTEEAEEMVDMELDLTDEEFLKIAKMAHSRDITFNKMIALILEATLEDLKRRDALAEMAEEAKKLELE